MLKMDPRSGDRDASMGILIAPCFATLSAVAAAKFDRTCVAYEQIIPP